MIPIVILDTNVVLDWLLFRDQSCLALEHYLGAGQIRWLATTAMREELMDVLKRGTLSAWEPNSEALLSRWALTSIVVPVAPSSAHLAGCRCTDPDDQKFVDLALAHQARWLLSRDRAVLRLGKHLRRLGVEVTKPDTCSLVRDTSRRLDSR